MKTKAVRKPAIYKGIEIYVLSETDDYYHVIVDEARADLLPNDFLEDMIHSDRHEWYGKISKKDTVLIVNEDSPPRPVHKSAIYRRVKVFVETEDENYYYVRFKYHGSIKDGFVEDLKHIEGTSYTGKIRKNTTQMYFLRENPPNKSL